MRGGIVIHSEEQVAYHWRSRGDGPRLGGQVEVGGREDGTLSTHRSSSGSGTSDAKDVSEVLAVVLVSGVLVLGGQVAKVR